MLRGNPSDFFCLRFVGKFWKNEMEMNIYSCSITAPYCFINDQISFMIPVQYFKGNPYILCLSPNWRKNIAFRTLEVAMKGDHSLLLNNTSRFCFFMMHVNKG